MLNAGNSNGFLTLYRSALGYLENGYSVIPVHTDPAHAKAATVGWRCYQQRRPAFDELHTWFVEQAYSGLAIVTGAVSGLAVLDLDDLALFDAFQHLCPDLAQTRCIRTKRGVHLWYHTHTGQRIQSRAGQGMDLKAEGGYVVAPPTVIDGYAYTSIHDRDPMLLTDSDWLRIQAFIRTRTTLTAERDRKSQEELSSYKIEASVESCKASQTPFIMPNGLINQYRYQAMNHSRNDALFHVSLRARDNGYALQDTLALLADCHARQSTKHPHKPETYRQRYREAVDTITSAYTRPPRSQAAQEPATAVQLPNSVREKLFQMGCTHTVRVIEALRQAGIQPGHALTYAQSVACLAGQVGQWSIRHALKTISSTGVPIFQKIPFAASPNTLAYADKSQANSLTNNAIGRPEKPTFLKSRKRPMGYIMPSNEELCILLNIKQTTSDRLTPEDLASAKTTRMAVHRELIRRRPGIYPRGWLAQRLGISDETIDDYNREIPIHVRHCYYEKPVVWHNLEDIPLSLDIAGTFLEDEQGKRYPAKREIARKLLADKHTVVYKHQQANFYSYGDGPPQPPSSYPLQPHSAVTPPQLPNNFHPGDAQAFSHHYYKQKEASPMPDRLRLPLPIAEPPPPLILRDDTAAQRRLAERVYQTVKRLTTDSAQHMSRANTHRLVETYGAAAVEQALKKLVWYAGKGKVTRPSGFLITTSRLAWRERQGGAGAITPAPRFRGVAVVRRRD